MAETAIRGFEHLAAKRRRDACLEARLAQFRDKARIWSLILPAVRHNAVNVLERKRSVDLEKRAARHFGRSLGRRIAGAGTVVLAGVWKLRIKIFGDGLQPKTIVTRYPAVAGVDELADRRLVGPAVSVAQQEIPPAAAAMSSASYGLTARPTENFVD
jgi:hypothetical protein